MRDEASQELEAARRLFSQALHDYRDAADLCAHDLGEAIDDGLKDHHSGGFLGGLGHVVGTIGHGVAAGVHAFDAGVAWVNDHLPSIDQVSELLGVAAAIASLTGCEPLALALSGAKTAIDLGQVLAGKDDWSKLRDDAIGFAMFGGGRVLTGVARGRVFVGAGSKIEDLDQGIRALKAERELATDAVQVHSLTVRLADQRSTFQSLRGVSKKFAEDAPGRFWGRSARLLTTKEAQLPALKELSLSRSALAAGGAVKGLELYGKVKDAKEIATKTVEWTDGREILASEGSRLHERKDG